MSSCRISRQRPLLRWLALAAAVLGAFAVTPNAWSQSPLAVELGEAPRRHEPQETFGWFFYPTPKAARSRADVVALYNDSYLPGNAAVLAWTGSISGCVVGATNVDHQQAVITRINYYRALVDLPGVTLEGGVIVPQVQAAALIMTANNQLSHTPPPSWLCFSADGATGASVSNIAIGKNGVGAIDLYMDDAGAGNQFVGHRRWVLHPPRASMATGDTTGNTTTNRPANALHVFGPTMTRPATPNGVAWPPAGYVPYQTLPAISNRWSLSYPGADFTNATVTMSGPGGAIPVTKEPLMDGFGDNTVVFLPTGISYTKPAADTTYAISVSNIAGAGVPPNIQYTVTVIDPASVPVTATAIAIEYYNAALDHYFLTHIANEIAILDAGVQIKGWQRTGQSFPVWIAAGAGTSPVCRYYIPPGLGNSHFYGRGTVECNNTGQKNPSFINEDPQFFHVVLPVAGQCPAGTQVVYRVFSNRADANHRYMIVRTLRDQMVVLGWLAEGDGPDLVVMCVPL